MADLDATGDPSKERGGGKQSPAGINAEGFAVAEVNQETANFN